MSKNTVYAGMRHPESSNAAAVEDLDAYPKEQSVNLHAVAMDVTEQDMVNAAIAQIIDETGRLDVVVHNAGHMVLGPTERRADRGPV